MKAYLCLILVLLLTALGILSGCEEDNTQIASQGVAEYSTHTTTLTEYSPSLPFITSAKPYSILDCSYSVLSRDSDYWDFGWTFTLRNDTSAPLSINAIIQLLYDTGYQVAAYKVPEIVKLAARSQQTLTGHLVVDVQDALQVRSITAFIGI